MSLEIINAKSEPLPGVPHAWGQGEGRGRGRPSKLTPERHARVLDEISKGTPIELVAAKCDIHEDTFYEWMTRGENNRLRNEVTIYSVFSEQVLIARDKYEAELAAKWIDISTKPQTKIRKVYKEKVLDDGTKVKYLDSEIVEETGAGDWQGIAEYMSRRYRRWKKKENIEHSGLDGGPIEVQSTVTIEQFPVWLKQAIVVCSTGIEIDPEVEKILMSHFEAKFLEAEKLVGNGTTGGQEVAGSLESYHAESIDAEGGVVEGTAGQVMTSVVEASEDEVEVSPEPSSVSSLDQTNEKPNYRPNEKRKKVSASPLSLDDI